VRSASAALSTASTEYVPSKEESESSRGISIFILMDVWRNIPRFRLLDYLLILSLLHAQRTACEQDIWIWEYNIDIDRFLDLLYIIIHNHNSYACIYLVVLWLVKTM